ncbi:uncharacterized protein LOC126900217 isoform X2 [Daktulosphaira vitifoliae]|uniref:uncharacterized protein LOC126900217 isoform X2 n=1 Tax=Daktulosphaira vitifoliae TaxID=58002 RepID=UPI0021AAE394|nr:uncharacterized protein LOC126900217 isoform X2 [Daktulosphaira vitifoliae]
MIFRIITLMVLCNVILTINPQDTSINNFGCYICQNIKDTNQMVCGHAYCKSCETMFDNCPSCCIELKRGYTDFKSITSKNVQPTIFSEEMPACCDCGSMNVNLYQANCSHIYCLKCLNVKNITNNRTCIKCRLQINNVKSENLKCSFCSKVTELYQKDCEHIFCCFCLNQFKNCYKCESHKLTENQDDNLSEIKDEIPSVNPVEYTIKKYHEVPSEKIVEYLNQQYNENSKTETKCEHCKEGPGDYDAYLYNHKLCYDCYKKNEKCSLCIALDNVDENTF